MNAILAHEAVCNRLLVYPVDLSNSDLSLDLEKVVPLGPPVQRTLHLVGWCRDLAGLHFDVLKIA